jgi:predicted amidohydrolase
MEEAARDGAQAACLPEYWLTGRLRKGQAKAYWDNLAEEIPARVLDKFC